MKKILPISILLLVIDQVIKLIIVNNISLNSSIIIIKNFFNLTYVRNVGAAFSILSGNIVLLIIISLVSFYLIYKYLIKNKELSKYEVIIYGALIGGLFGNLIDRIRLGYVIDYLDFKIFNYDYPIFNFADMCIVLSVILLIFSFKGEKNEDNK